MVADTRDSRIEDLLTMKPQDVVILLRLVSESVPWTYPELSVSVGMSSPQVRRGSPGRAAAAGLYNPRTRHRLAPTSSSLSLTGCATSIPSARWSGRGMRTAHAARPLRDMLVAPANDVPPVWADPDGDTRGEIWSPLYPSVPTAARNHPGLYELLALVDAIRGGRPRERELAVQELTRRLR